LLPQYRPDEPNLCRNQIRKPQAFLNRSMLRSSCFLSIRREAKYMQSMAPTYPPPATIHRQIAGGLSTTRNNSGIVAARKSTAAPTRSHRSHHGLRCFTPAHWISQYSGWLLSFATETVIGAMDIIRGRHAKIVLLVRKKKETSSRK
jgi:hypothetical protein